MPIKQKSSFKPVERAAAHPIIAHKTVVNFFEGALLGNGGLGAVVVTRPVAVVVHFGHNNVWDIRVAEDNNDKIGTFKEIFERVKAIPETYQVLEQDSWFDDYVRTMAQNYGKIYPRPFPCGLLILGFDRRRAEIVGHRLDVSNGVCDVQFLVDGQPAILRIFVDMTADRVWLRMQSSPDGAAAPASPFERLRLLPDPEKNPGMLVALENNNLDMEARAALNLPPVEELTGSASDSLSFR